MVYITYASYIHHITIRLLLHYFLYFQCFFGFFDISVFISVYTSYLFISNSSNSSFILSFIIFISSLFNSSSFILFFLFLILLILLLVLLFFYSYLFSFWRLDVCRTGSYEITLVRLSIRPSVTKFSPDWIISFF